MNPARQRAVRISPLLRAACAAALAATTGIAATQDFPTRTVAIVVPTSPGTASDIIGREVAQRLGPALGRSVVVENRAGASGNIGTDYAAQARPDGHVLFMASTSGVINEISNAPKSRLAKDFDPVALAGVTPFALAVPADFPANSVADLVAEARRRPGQLNYAGFVGGIVAFLGQMLKSSTGIDIVMVPYKSTTDAQVDVLAGRVPIWFTTAAAAMNVAKGNRIRILAVTSNRRVSLAPNIPTMKEAGFPALTIEVTFYFLAPLGTPKPVLARLNREINQVMAGRELLDKLALSGVEATPPASPEDVAKLISGEFAQWERIIAAASTQK